MNTLTALTTLLSEQGYMSDHLPVILQLEVDSEQGLEADPHLAYKHWISQEAIFIDFEQPFSGSISIRSLSGKEVIKDDCHDKMNYILSISGLSKGLYLLVLESKDGISFLKFTH